MRKGSSDILAGLGFLVIAGAFGVQYDELEGVSRVFPEALISFISLGGLYFILKGCWRRRLERATESDEPVVWSRVGVISVMAMAYLIVLTYIGFFVATAAFLFTSYMLLGDRSRGPVRLCALGAGFSVVVTGLVWLGVVALLNVPVPEGLLF